MEKAKRKIIWGLITNALILGALAVLAYFSP